MVHSLGGRRQKRRRSFASQVGDGDEIDYSVTTIGAMLES
ncbi:hypothetical protein COLO4_36391 [Corchorus olitorius]|uniref:Uncharacterized protein n=1 Tax=Corchorus olitorius TaxID=93759 RepID=A0A1R3G974_9ROSI|nr:hypothetical protein COLO4_36391 [Corchorus olitorius]